MSGIYIPNMGIPYNCGHCFLRRGECEERIYMPNRPSNCPLIPAPDHGRLIDADALYEMCTPTGWDGKTRSDYVCAISGYQIKQAPTIIPADKEEQT